MVEHFEFVPHQAPHTISNEVDGQIFVLPAANVDPNEMDAAAEAQSSGMQDDRPTLQPLRCGSSVWHAVSHAQLILLHRPTQQFLDSGLDSHT